MSRFFSSKYQHLTPYTPGEQPRDQQYIKLNTNESPFPPVDAVLEAAREAASLLHLYPDPDAGELRRRLADLYGVTPDELTLSNGSDDLLNFAFMAYCDDETPAVYADITYGFYPVFADLNRVTSKIIPLREDFSICEEDYRAAGGTIFIANPNAPTGKALSPDAIRSILESNRDNIVVIDEAYVDFGAESCVPLIHTYPNLLVIQTFSKSRSMAGARLGMCFGDAALISDLNTIRYATNPYNVNRMTAACAVAAIDNEDIIRARCREVMDNRAYTDTALKGLGFDVIESKANFLFARHPMVSGKELYQELKSRGILVRHFDKPRLDAYIRITIGSREHMETFIATLEDILLKKKEEEDA